MIADPAQLLVAPSYLKFPSYVEVKYFYELVPAVNFASVIVDPVLGPCVKISSTNPLDFGLHTLNLKVTEQFSGLTHTTSFNVFITCVRSIVPATQLGNQTYYIYDP